MRTTVADVRFSRVPQVLGICSTDVRLVQFLNEAVQRLLTRGHWWGSYARFRLCATGSCITFPPQIATLEKVSICGTAVPIHDLWFEFLENGYGTRNASTSSDGSSCGCGAVGGCMDEANYRGNYPTYQDIRGTDKKVKLVCDKSGDIGKTVLVLGYDQNGNWIRTTQGGVVMDGEVITLAQGAGTISTNYFQSITDIQLPERDGQVWLYEYKVADATSRLIATYQYFETRPSYPRYFFPGLCPGTNSADNCNTAVVEVIAKLAFIPVKNDTDYLIIGNIPALKEMCRAIYLSENEPDGEKAAKLLSTGEAMALRELDNELHHHLGDGRTIGVDIQGSNIGDIEPIEAFL